MGGRFSGGWVCIGLFSLAGAVLRDDLENYVNILQGTENDYTFSTGNLLPLVARPWGMATWAPSSSDGDGWWFNPFQRSFFGIRMTHQPSPWIGDYGHFSLTAEVGHHQGTPVTSINPSLSTFKPYLFNTSLLAYGNRLGPTTLAHTATERSAAMKVNFAPYDPTALGTDQTRRLVVRIEDLNMSMGTATPYDDKLLEFIPESMSQNNGSLWGGSMWVDNLTNTIVGWTQVNNGGVPKNATDGRPLFRQYFYMAIETHATGTTTNTQRDDRPPSSARIVAETEANSRGTTYQKPGPPRVEAAARTANGQLGTGHRAEGLLEWAASDVSAITVRIGTSLISLEQAKINLEQEQKGAAFEEVVAESAAVWRSTLGRVKVIEVDDDAYEGQGPPRDEYYQLTTFYSCLYRSVLFPRRLFEYRYDNDTRASPYHWSPYTGTVLDGVMTGDSGFWDSYRTVYPQLSLLYPDVLGEILQGWVNAATENNGWIPEWPSPGSRGSMVGTMGDIVLADGIVNKIPGFDTKAAYAAIRKDCFEVGKGTDGRAGLDSYTSLGYVPTDDSSRDAAAAVSVTLNYALSDWAASNAAAAMGQDDDASLLLSRSQGWTKLFDSDAGGYTGQGEISGFLRGKTKNGTWAGMGGTAEFDEFWWGDPYTEAGPWQYRFYAPHDPTTLSSLYDAANQGRCDRATPHSQSLQQDGQEMGCSEKAGAAICAALDDMVNGTSVPGVFHKGGYGNVIHEMTEMATIGSQYEHNNQPVHHVLYMFGQSGCAERGQRWIRHYVEQLYTNETFCGDEDNGELASWYILSALGLYGLAPSSGSYQIGSPLFAHVQVDRGDGKPVDILAKGNGPKAVYVNDVSWNGGPLATPSSETHGGLQYSEWIQGGKLAFGMSESPASA